MGQHVSWRKFRNATVKQCDAIDFLTCQGEYVGTNAKSRHRRLLYGGAGYGGKSHCIRTAAGEICGVLRDAGFPGQMGMILCRKYTDLADRQIIKIKKEFTHDHNLGKVVTSRIEGMYFKFHDKSLGGFYLRNADNADKYRGAEVSFVLVDELTEWLKADYDFITYPLRSDSLLPFLAFMGASNPDGIGHGWVKEIWIERNFESVPDIIPDSAFHFIQAFAQDNPTFTPEVQALLEGFDDDMLVKSRWLGSWDLVAGLRFSRFNRKVHTFTWEQFEKFYDTGQTYEALLRDPDAFHWFGSLDYGTDIDAASAFYLYAVDWNRVCWCVYEAWIRGKFLDEQAQVMHNAITERTPNQEVHRIYCDPSLNSVDSDGISRLSKFVAYGLPMAPGINDREEGWASIDEFLKYRLEEGTRYDAEGGPFFEYHPKLRFHEDCVEARKFFLAAPRDDIKREDVSRKFKRDHGGDSIRYFVHSHFHGPTEGAD